MRRHLLLLIGSWALSACSAGAAYKISGSVLDESANYSPVPGGTVTMAGHAPLQTDPNGTFEIALDEIPSTFALRVSAPGYATRTLTVAGSLARISVIRALLRPQDTVTTVALPAGPTDPAPTVKISRTASTTSLQLPYNSLVVAATGARVSGNVDVGMTYWPANENLESAPAPLVGRFVKNPNAVGPLHTYGMVDIEIRQNGELLQIAPDSGLPLTVSVSPDILHKEAVMSPKATPPMPSLFYADPNTGIWIEQITPDSGAIAYDPNTGSFSGTLPHLTAWNWDFGPFTTATKSGCMSGQAISTVGNAPFTGQIAVTMLTFEGIAAVSTTPAADGSWCLQVGMNADDSEQLNYYISAANDFTNSSQPNPLLSPELTPFIPNMATWWTQLLNICTSWWYTQNQSPNMQLSLGGDTQQNPNQKWGSCATLCPTNYYGPVHCTDCIVQGPSGPIAIPHVVINEGNACPNGCPSVGITYISTGAPGAPSAVGYTGCPMKNEGDACNPSVCCTKPLVCQDGECVPP